MNNETGSGELKAVEIFVGNQRFVPDERVAELEADNERLHSRLASAIAHVAPETLCGELRQEAERYQARLRELEAERDTLREELAWYGEQARLARLIHSEGDAGRHAIAADGGQRARAALEGK